MSKKFLFRLLGGGSFRAFVETCQTLDQRNVPIFFPLVLFPSPFTMLVEQPSNASRGHRDNQCQAIRPRHAWFTSHKVRLELATFRVSSSKFTPELLKVALGEEVVQPQINNGPQEMEVHKTENSIFNRKLLIPQSKERSRGPAYPSRCFSITATTRGSISFSSALASE